jgi:isocitrate dehydrogenase
MTETLFIIIMGALLVIYLAFVVPMLIAMRNMGDLYKGFPFPFELNENEKVEAKNEQQTD